MTEHTRCVACGAEAYPYALCDRCRIVETAIAHDLLGHVERATGVSRADMRGRDRGEVTCRARAVAAYMLRRHTLLVWTDLARLLQRAKSSVIHGASCVVAAMTALPPMQDDAARKIEALVETIERSWQRVENETRARHDLASRGGSCTTTTTPAGQAVAS